MIADVKKTAEQKMKKIVETLKARPRQGAHRARAHRAARPHPGRLLRHADAAQPGRERDAADARTIAVQPCEKKMVQVIEKAIRDSDLGLNPATSGDIDPRADARAHRGAPQGADQGGAARGRERERRGAQHPPRRERRTSRSCSRTTKVAEDDERRAQDDVQKLTDRYIAEIDKLLHAKEAELMAV